MRRLYGGLVTEDRLPRAYDIMRAYGCLAPTVAEQRAYVGSARPDGRLRFVGARRSA